MAIGFIPSESSELSLNGHSERVVVASIYKALNESNWDLDVIGNQSIIADNSSFLRAGHTLEISWNDSKISITCKLNGIITDLGSCRRVLVNMIRKIQSKFLILTETEIEHYAGVYQKSLEDLLAQTSVSFSFKLLDFIIPGKDNYLSPVLCWSILAVFVVGEVHSFFYPESSWQLAVLGGNIGLKTLSGEWWRLGTAIFIHLGYLHVLVNSLNLLFLGFLLEKKIGYKLLFFTFLMSGIAGNVCSVWWHPYEVLSAGASGALFGWMGVLLVLLITKSISDDSKRSYLISACFLIGLNLLYGLKDASDNAAHLGGLCSGVFLGFSWTVFLEKKRSWIVKTGFALFTITLIGMSVMLLNEKSNRMALVLKERSEYVLLRRKILSESLALLGSYSDFINAPKSAEDRYELSDKHRLAFLQLKANLGTFKPQYLSEVEKQDIKQIALFLEKNSEYCSVYKTMLSPGGETLYPQFKLLKEQIDSLNYTIFR